MATTSSTSRDRGFTLLEVMVALMVAAMAFVGLLALHTRNLDLVGGDLELTRATLLARDQFTRLELMSGGFPELGTHGGEIPGYPDFRWELEVDDTDLAEVRRCRLRVIFDETTPDLVSLLYYVRDRRELDALP